MAKKINLGKVGICPMGDYASGKSYERLSSVFYNHEYWVAVKDVPVGAVPSATSEYWQKMASRGEQGPQGQSYVDKELVPIVDNLTTGGSSNVLSAEQGKILSANKLGMLGAGIYVTTFAIVAGSDHSSTKDRIPVSIKTGETFYTYIRKRNGAELTQASISVTATGYDSWQTIGNQKAYNPPTKWTAQYDITEIGYYIAGTQIQNSGEIDIVVIANPLAALL